MIIYDMYLRYKWRFLAGKIIVYDFPSLKPPFIVKIQMDTVQVDFAQVMFDDQRLNLWVNQPRGPGAGLDQLPRQKL